MTRSKGMEMGIKETCKMKNGVLSTRWAWFREVLLLSKHWLIIRGRWPDRSGN